MTDITQPVVPSPGLSSIPNFPMPSTTPVMAKKRSYLVPIIISLVAIVVVSAGLYFVFSNRTPATVAEIAPYSASTLKTVNETMEAIPSITTPVTWSTPISSSIKDINDTDIYGEIIGTPPVAEDDESVAKLFSADSPLVTTYGWTKSENESDPNQLLTVFQKDNLRLYIRYEIGSYFVLIAEI